MSLCADLDFKDSFTYLKIRFSLVSHYIQEEDRCQKVRLNWSIINFTSNDDFKPKPEL